MKEVKHLKKVKKHLSQFCKCQLHCTKCVLGASLPCSLTVIERTLKERKNARASAKSKSNG